MKSSRHVFLDLDKLQGEVEAFQEKSLAREDQRWSANAIAIARGWFKTGLDKRCITRDLKWGVPVPLEGYEDKVCPFFVILHEET